MYSIYYSFDGWRWRYGGCGRTLKEACKAASAIASSYKANHWQVRDAGDIPIMGGYV